MHHIFFVLFGISSLLGQSTLRGIFTVGYIYTKGRGECEIWFH